jgi:chondroitin-sulfate-ABC endolyase/exolyase
MPYSQMANGHGTMSERSSETFIGGLSHRGRNGLFVMTLNSGHQYRKGLPEGEKPVTGHAFRGKKTYFFFDDRIICLGSDIENHDSSFPVQTNLFQKFLAAPDQSIQVDGKELRELPLSRSLDAEVAHTLIDTQGTGYYVPGGQSLHMARQHQKSRDGHDKKDTEGDYATAWLDHGANPKDAGYEYFLLVQTTPSRLRRFARKMKKPKTQPCLVWQKDQHAHVVLDRGTGTWGCVFFEEQDVKLTTADPPRAGPGLWARIKGMRADPVLPVKKVLQPCLLMAQQTGRGSWQMSLADPDLNLGKDGISQPTTVKILIPGRWRLSDAPDNVRLEPAEDGNWLLTAECREGRSYDLELASEKKRK